MVGPSQKILRTKEDNKWLRIELSHRNDKSELKRRPYKGQYNFDTNISDSYTSFKRRVNIYTLNMK